MVFAEPWIARALGIFAACHMHVDKAAILASCAYGAFSQKFCGFFVGIRIRQVKAVAARLKAHEVFVELKYIAIPRGGDVIDNVRMEKPGIEN